MNPRLTRPLAIIVGALLTIGVLATGLLPPAAIVLSIPFLLLLAFGPVIRRLAFGHVTRRPRETVLIILGSLLGTAIITGAFVVGDTLNESISHGMYSKLGPVDVLVTSLGDTGALASELKQKLPPTVADGVLTLTSATVTVANAKAQPKAEPNAHLLEVDFAQAATFGGDPKATGISGPTPGAGEAVLGIDTAHSLDVKAGDNVRLFAYGAERDLRVTRTLPRLGIAGLDMQRRSRSPNVFVAPGLIESLAATGPTKGSPPQQVVAVSAAGGVAAHADNTTDLEKAISHTAAAGAFSVQIVPAKQQLRAAAKRVGDSFTQLFSFIGLFSILAGILLLVNIFVMLAQERQSELGMLRAVGLRRLGLVGAFSLEGWIYALASSAFGMIAGLGVGRLIVGIAAGLFAGGGPAGEGGLELVFSPRRASLSAGFLIGFVISLVTVVITSAWISRLNVIRAIRELPTPARTRTRPVWLVLGGLLIAVGLLTTLGAISQKQPQQILIGPCLAALGVVPFAGRKVVQRRIVLSADAGALLAWTVMAFSLFPHAFRSTRIVIFVIQGIILVAAGVALLSQNQELIGGGIRRVAGGGRSTSLRLGLAYPLARRFRTSMTLAMYALVVYMLATITVFSHLFGSQISQFTASISGGFDLIVSSNPTNPVPLDKLRKQPGVADAAALSETFGDWTPVAQQAGTRRATGTTGWPAASFDEAFIAARAPSLSSRPAEYKTDADAYHAVLANPDLFIPTAFFLSEGGGPPAAPKVGEQFVLRDPLSGHTRKLTVAAVAQAGFGSIRPLMSHDALQSVFGARAVPNVFYVHTAPGVDAKSTAQRLNGAFLVNGADAQSFIDIVSTNLSQQQGFFRLMRGYLALGLVVGIAGLGVVMVRAVRERRREIGVLRALGFDPASVRRAFLVESGFVAFEGIITGTLLAVVTTWRLTSNADFGATLKYDVPWVALGTLIVATIVASLMATAAPAQQASRIKPAVALRIAD